MHSFCAAKNQAECHYRRRRPRSRLQGTSTSRQDFPSSARNPGHDDGATRDSPSLPPGGRSFWRTGSDTAAATPGARVLPTPPSSEAGDGCLPGRSLSLKRYKSQSSEGIHRPQQKPTHACRSGRFVRPMHKTVATLYVDLHVQSENLPS